MPSAGGGHDVGGVAGQEQPPGLHRLGDIDYAAQPAEPFFVPLS